MIAFYSSLVEISQIVASCLSGIGIGQRVAVVHRVEHALDFLDLACFLRNHDRIHLFSENRHAAIREQLIELFLEFFYESSLKIRVSVFFRKEEYQMRVRTIFGLNDRVYAYFVAVEIGIDLFPLEPACEHCAV